MSQGQGVRADCSDGVEEEQKQEGEQKESAIAARPQGAPAAASGRFIRMVCSPPLVRGGGRGTGSVRREPGGRLLARPAPGTVGRRAAGTRDAGGDEARRP